MYIAQSRAAVHFFEIQTSYCTHTGGLGELPSDVNQLVLLGFLFELQLFHD